MPSLPTLEQMPSSLLSNSSSIDTLESNPILKDANVTTGESNLDATTPQQSLTPPPPTPTLKRKRKNSTMIIKPARWSPPLHHHHHSSALVAATPIETDFQPTFYNPNEIKHRRRISSQQYGILEDEYQINTKPNASKRHHLAELLGMTPRTVQIWFQNKRAKAKHQLGKPSQAEKKPSTIPAIKPLAATATQPSSSHSNSTAAALGPVDQFIFNDGRLDPIYLMDDYDMAVFMAASSSPSLSSTTSTVTSNQYGINQNSSSDGDDDNGNMTAGVELMDDNYGQQPSMVDDHGTTTAATSSSSSVSLSPLLPPSDKYDSFAMGLHHSINTNQHQHQHQCYDETQFSASTASSSPSQQFSPLDSSFNFYQHHNAQLTDTIFSTMDASSSSSSSPSELYSIMKENDDDQEQQLRHDALYILDWMQKTPTDPHISTSMVPTWPYVMDHPDLQNDCLDFGLDHNDWMGPFNVSA